MHESIQVADLQDRLDRVVAGLRAGQRFILADGDVPVAAVVSLADLNDLEETDAVLADQGLLEALREARVASEDPATYEP